MELLAYLWGGAGLRAEPALAVPWRPPLLALIALALVRARGDVRATGYAAMLIGGGAAALAATGRIDLRGLAVGAGAALLLDGVAQAGATLGGRALAGIGLVVALAVPGAGRVQRLLATGDGLPHATGIRVAVLTGVPLRWEESEDGGAGGNGGAGLAALRPAAAWAWLDAAYTLIPADGVSGSVRHWLIVQPRGRGPAGLVAIDALLRGGARAVILTDPLLRWPDAHAAGDPAAPPRRQTLAPLLSHWGLRLVADGSGLAVRDLMWGGRRWRLALPAPGRFVADGAGAAARCRIAAGGLVADCAVGAGRAILLADADLLAADAWTAADGGAAPAFRASDNLAFVAALLAALDGRAAPARPVAWR